MSRYQFRVLFFPAFCLLCISINSSCVRDNDNTMSFDGFSNVEMIEGAIEKCPAVIIDPTRMFILDDFLFVLQKKANQLVTIIDLNANALSLQFGLQGSGPGEFSNVNSNYFLKYNDPEPGFTIGNRGNQLQFYKLKDLLKGNDTEYKIESIIPKAMRLRAGALFSDTTLWGASYMPNVDIFKLHFENGGFEPVMDYPLDFPLLSTQTKRDIFGCYFSAKPDNSKLAITYANQAVLKIIDVKSNKSVQIEYKDFPDLSSNFRINEMSDQIDKESLRIFSWRVRSTNQFIYIKVYDVLYKDLIVDGRIDEDFIPAIHIFDWSGKPIRAIQPDQYYKNFDVSSDDKYIITISEYVDNYYVKYDL